MLWPRKRQIDMNQDIMTLSGPATDILIRYYQKFKCRCCYQGYMGSAEIQQIQIIPVEW
jgi:hypothetical protein